METSHLREEIWGDELFNSKDVIKSEERPFEKKKVRGCGVRSKESGSKSVICYSASLCFCCLSLFSSVQVSHSVVSGSLRPHELQHARPPYPSPTPGVYPNSCPLSRWCHPAISSSVPFSSCPQSLPASGSFPVSQLFTWSAKVLEFQLHHTLKNTVWVNIFQDVNFDF